MPRTAKLQIVSSAPNKTPESAGCLKCDDGMDMATGHHHADGSVCRIVQRNNSFTSNERIPPLGRYDPRRDKYL